MTGNVTENVTEDLSLFNNRHILLLTNVRIGIRNSRVEKPENHLGFELYFVLRARPIDPDRPQRRGGGPAARLHAEAESMLGERFVVTGFSSTLVIEN